jgi:hypothetical protein
VQFVGVYVREAHPTDGWRMESNDREGIAIAQPTTDAERTAVAARCCQSMKMTIPLVVDTIDDRVGNLYSGMPDRLYLIGRDGRVVYKSGRGPFGFKPGELEQSIIMHLLDLRSPSRAARLPVLTNDEAWGRLPAARHEVSQPLPAWAKATAAALPRTTAAVLELDYLHRAASPIEPRLRAKMRWVAAHANRCGYAEEYARADLRRAGGDDSELTRDHRQLPEAERLALTFADKLTTAASTVTDAEVQRLRQLYGDAKVVAMVQLLAFANFQDRLLLTLGVEPEIGGPLPPLAVHFDSATRPPVPPRRSPTAAGEAPGVKSGEEWTKLDFDFLQKKLESQRQHPGRIPVPSWETVKRRLPDGYPLPPRPVGIRWSLVCIGYQPRLALAWSACTRAFAEEAKQDRVFEESLFWVVTRSLECFY